jgi:hypothetical protein
MKKTYTTPSVRKAGKLSAITAQPINSNKSG